MNSQLSQQFEVEIGVHQEPILSLLFSVIVLIALCHNLKTLAPRDLLYYANDLVIMPSYRGCSILTLDVVDKFCYLGNTLSSGGECTKVQEPGVNLGICSLSMSRGLPTHDCGSEWSLCATSILYGGKTWMNKICSTYKENVTLYQWCQTHGLCIALGFAGQKCI